MNAKQNQCSPPANIFTCHPHAPDPEIITAAATAIRSGEVVCFPTSCLYGLGADAWNPEAVKRIFALKKRPPDRPVLVLIDSLQRLEQLVVRIPPIAHELIGRFWPGRLTLVFEARAAVPQLLTAGTGKIGVRLPGHPVSQALVRAVMRPLTATSANISGEPGCHRSADIPDSIRSAVAMLLDSGPLAGGAGSTVVDVCRDRPRVLREGAIESAAIQR